MSKSLIVIWDSAAIEVWVGNVSQPTFDKLQQLHLRYFNSEEEVYELKDYVFDEDGLLKFPSYGLRRLECIMTSVSGTLVVSGVLQ